MILFFFFFRNATLGLRHPVARAQGGGVGGGGGLGVLLKDTSAGTEADRHRGLEP